MELENRQRRGNKRTDRIPLKALALSVAFGAFGCAGSSEIVTPSPVKATAMNAELRYLIQRDYAPNDTSLARVTALGHKQAVSLADVLERRLRDYGYHTTEQILAGGDVEISIEVMPGLQEDEVTLLISAWVEGRSRSSVSFSFDPEEAVSEPDVQRVLAIATRPETTSAGLDYRRRRREAMQLQVTDQLEDDVWSGVDLNRCLQAADEHACDSVYRYLTRLPNGAHAGEALDTINRARDAVRENTQEERFWSDVKMQCSDPQGRCVRLLRGYLKFWPAGAYASEATHELEVRT